jgi:hypothetical protein
VQRVFSNLKLVLYKLEIEIENQIQ